MSFTQDDIQNALTVLRNGGIILYPTDTVWGIGCDATNEAAVRRIYALKQREDSKSMLCLLDGMGRLRQYVEEIPDMAYDLIEYAEKPLTIIYDNARGVAPNLIAEDGSIGFRITQEPFTKTLCERLHAPLVSTSANISGEKTPRNFRQISDEIKSGVDYVVQYRQKDTEQAQPSAIVKLGKGNVVKVIRS